MKRTLFISAILSLVMAPTRPAMAEDFQTGEVNLGVQQVGVDTLSSKFYEYRDVPNGAVGPYARLFGQKGDLRYDFSAVNFMQDDERYRAKLGNEKFRLDFDYNGIPHRFGNDGRTLLQGTKEGVWQLSDTLQGAYQGAIAAVPRPAVTYNFLNKLVAPGLATAKNGPGRHNFRDWREETGAWMVQIGGWRRLTSPRPRRRMARPLGLEVAGAGSFVSSPVNNFLGRGFHGWIWLRSQRRA